ncbi:dTDP-4-dehydrorhamnose reductase [Salinisphaera sp.]|uniref:dTDP-4-dehydrorhamnose reductase n=1 Tax=Salinisphaera sp. TaxID=1914330 RepID=UPI000C6B89D3|nr:dTDP-4-dehydrorhamnose reductase [Salinisphaera sp.]MAS08606.1 dTDP-4-dehydrorhamnose reductase [Salinisphaera sp.]|tara:strand:+ start:7110 stop:8030 length:921 start_codon:yes stop_codon:yes gene_type:complete
MTILLLGKNGQVGWELQRALAPLGEVIALGRVEPNGLTGDLCDSEALKNTVRQIKPSIIVNAAAYTAVDAAEEQRDLATQVNAKAPAIIAAEAARLDATFVHFSTDYVFNGTGTEPWQETDTPEPLNHYGASKLQGEQAIAQSGCRHLIFRTSWVYAAQGQNFVNTMCRLMHERDTLQVIEDQIGAPTGAELIADVTAHALRRSRSGCDEPNGVFHLTAKGETSWFGLAQHIARQLRSGSDEAMTQTENIEPIATSAWPSAARRPLNSRLALDKLEQSFELSLPGWQQGVSRVLHEHGNSFSLKGK